MPKVALLLPGSESGLGPGPASPSTTWTLEGLQDVGTEVRCTHVSQPLWCPRKSPWGSPVQGANIWSIWNLGVRVKSHGVVGGQDH